jgi:heme exporter protein A
MLTIENINIYYGDAPVLSGVGFSVYEGCCLIIKGSNGIGKTSLLKIICGLTKPDAGNIYWQKQNIDNILPDYQQQLKFIGHKNFFKTQLTVLENIKFYSSFGNTEINVPMALHFFELLPVADLQIKKLSAGWQQKALLALLLIDDYKLWLLDEPSRNLDLVAKQKLHSLIKTRVEQKGIVLLVTHDDFFDNLGQVINLDDFGG